MVLAHGRIYCSRQAPTLFLLYDDRDAMMIIVQWSAPITIRSCRLVTGAKRVVNPSLGARTVPGAAHLSSLGNSRTSVTLAKCTKNRPSSLCLYQWAN